MAGGAGGRSASWGGGERVWSTRPWSWAAALVGASWPVVRALSSLARDQRVLALAVMAWAAASRSAIWSRRARALSSRSVALAALAGVALRAASASVVALARAVSA